MKFGCLIFIAFLLSGCEKNKCKASANPDCVCVSLYEPVCGCDELTYGNECEASCYGIPEFTPGECK